MAMDAGARDRYVLIQQQTVSAGGSHFPVGTWTDLDSVWMNKRDAGASERFKAAQISAYFDTTWGLTYREDMDPEIVDVTKTRRLVYKGRTYDITSARQLDRNAEIELLTLAGGKVA